ELGSATPDTSRTPGKGFGSLQHTDQRHTPRSGATLHLSPLSGLHSRRRGRAERSSTGGLRHPTIDPCPLWGRGAALLLVLVLDEPRVVRALLPIAELPAQFGKRLGVGRIARQVAGLVRVGLEIVELL